MSIPSSSIVSQSIAKSLPYTYAVWEKDGVRKYLRIPYPVTVKGADNKRAYVNNLIDNMKRKNVKWAFVELVAPRIAETDADFCLMGA